MEARVVLVFIIGFMRTLNAQVDFSTNVSAGCEPLIVKFTNNTPKVAKWAWDFGNGNTSNMQNPDALYYSGIYSVALKVWDASGNLIGSKNSINLINCFAGPKITFSISDSIACIGQWVNFIVPQNTNLKSCLWDFGDGNTLNGFAAKHAYSQNGNYSIRILVKDNNGCGSALNLSNYIKVMRPSVSILSDYYFCGPTAIVSMEASTDFYTNFDWEIVPDNIVKSGKKIDFVANGYGVHRCNLISKRPGTTCEMQESRNVELIDPNKVTFSTNVSQICTNSDFKLIYKGINGCTNISIDFGDGQRFSYIKNDYNYKKAGKYKIKATFVFINCTVTRETDIEVLDILAPIVSGTVEVVSKCNPIQLKLKDNNFKRGNYWSIINDSVPSDINYYSYKSSQPYQKILLIYWYGPNNVCRTFKEFDFLISQPQVNINAICNNPPGCNQFDYTFTPQSYCASCKYKWYVNEEYVVDTNIFNHKFITGGNQLVKVVLTDTNNCTDESVISIFTKILNFPGRITTDVTYGACPPLLANLKIEDSSNNWIQHVVWDFGDGDSAYIINPKHLFLNSGTFNVSADVYINGCLTKLHADNLIKVDGPKADFIYSTISTCAPVTHTFQLKNFHKVQSAYLDFGDGKVEKFIEPVTVKKVYNRPGTIAYPSLILVDTLGCENKIRNNLNKYIKLYPDPVIDIQRNYNQCLNKPVLAENASGLNTNLKIKYNWYVDDFLTSTQDKLNYVATSNGIHEIKLWLENEFNCKKVDSTYVKLFKLTSGIKNKNDTLCTGEKWRFQSLLSMDTTIDNVKWYLNNKYVKTAVAWDTLFNSAGIYSIKFVATDALGCSEEVNKKDGFIVGDTTIPKSINLHYVTVESNNGNRVYFEAPGTWDYRNTIIYDSKSWKIIDSVSNKNATSYLHKNIQTSSQSYCYKVGLQNICRRRVDPKNLKEHCTILLSTNAYVNKNTISFTNYIGWDSTYKYELMRKVDNGNTEFLKKFEPNENKNFIDSNLLCNKRYSYFVTLKKRGGMEYVTTSNVNTLEPIIINKLNPIYPYLANFSEQENSNGVSVNLANLSSKYWVTKYNLFEYDNHNKLVAKHDFIGNGDTVIKIIRKQNNYSIFKLEYSNNCGEKSPISAQVNTIHLQVKINYRNLAQLDWNAYNYWAKGVSKYYILRAIKNSTYEIIDSVSGLFLTYEDNKTNPSLYDHCKYKIMAISFNENIAGIATPKTVMSNSDVAKIVERPLVYIPTAFTPNRDLINDEFVISCLFESKYNLLVFDKWGEIVFRSQSDEFHWNGSFNGGQATDGVYAYVLKIEDNLGKAYEYRGTVHLMR